MNKNRFSLRRCWSLLKGDLQSSRLDILLLVGAIFLVILAVALFSVLTPSITYSQIPDLSISSAEIAALSAMGNMGLAVNVAEVVIFSRVFANMSTRSGEISYLMLPATNSEKWLSRVVYVLLVGFVLILFVYYLAVLFCGLLGWMFSFESLSLLPKMAFDSTYVANLFHFQVPRFVTLVNSTTQFFIVAAFVLGGTWFRRLPWLYTALILLGTFFVVCITGAFGIGYYFLHHAGGNQEFIDAVTAHNINAMFACLTPLFYVCSAVLLVLGIVMLWLSYRLFCHRQLQSQRIIVLKS